MKLHNTIIKQFKKKNNQQKKIGIEVELPLVQQTGEAVSYDLVHRLFLYLATQGFKLVQDNGILFEAVFDVKEVPNGKAIITTDLGYSTLEIVLPPFSDLFAVKRCFKTMVGFLLPFVEKHNCRLLGYGTHPLTPPNRNLLMPRQRYKGLEKIWKTNTIVPKSMGNDTHLLTISAGNQCHIDVSETEAVKAANVLNASSGLQIALQANSPIFKGTVVKNYKAVREKFYDFLFAKTAQRHGVAPTFETLENYFQHIFHQKLYLVVRNKEVLQVFDYTFEEYLEQETVMATRLNGEKINIVPSIHDIHYHNTLCYLNARLVPRYGTIEVRMPCQQPPNETMVTAALNLGLMENLDEAESFFNQYDHETWQYLRTEAIQYAFQAQLPNGKSIVFLIEELLTIAKKGLIKRGQNEAVFLNPLFERLKTQEAPADKAIKIFNKKGMKGLLDAVSFDEAALSSTFKQPILKPLANLKTK